MIAIYTPNNEVVNRNDVNTQAGTVRVDIPTPEEEQALLAYEEHFRQTELASFVQNARDHAVIAPAVYDFEDYASALGALTERKATGKVVLKVGS